MIFFYQWGWTFSEKLVNVQVLFDRGYYILHICKAPYVLYDFVKECLHYIAKMSLIVLRVHNWVLHRLIGPHNFL